MIKLSKVWIKIFIFFLINNGIIFAYQYQLAIASIFQNEAPYLKEWIEFHKLLGVQHFYLLNNFSTDNYKEVLDPYIKNGVVEIFNWFVPVGKDGRWQLSGFNFILNFVRGKVKWLALIDLDEFLFPVQHNNLLQFLAEYENFSGVCANWVMYGTSNVKSLQPNDLQIETLTYRAEVNHRENLHVKSIIKPDFVMSFSSPHYANYKPGHYQVTANKAKFRGPFSPTVAIDKLRINHYCTRDEKYFHQVKIPRRLHDMGEPAHKCLARNALINKIQDKVIFKYIPQLKLNMNMK